MIPATLARYVMLALIAILTLGARLRDGERSA